MFLIKPGGIFFKGGLLLDRKKRRLHFNSVSSLTMIATGKRNSLLSLSGRVVVVVAVVVIVS